MKNPSEILVELWFGDLDCESIQKWAYEYILKNNDIPEEIFELLDADVYSHQALLLKVAKSSDPQFCHQSINAEILAAKLLITVGTRYLNGELKPLDVCRLVDKIDSGFLGAPRGLPDKISYYPEWLGNLYNSCDWCDETWTANNSNHLAENLKTQIDVINEWVTTFHLGHES